MPAETLAQERYRRQMLQVQIPQPSRLAVGSPYAIEKPTYPIETPTAKPYGPFVTKTPSPIEALQQWFWEKVFRPERTAEEAQVKQQFEAQVSEAEAAARQQFEEELEQQAKTLKYKAVEEIKIYEWEQEQKQAFETEISQWQVEQQQTYEEHIQQWRTQWKPIGIAERIVSFDPFVFVADVFGFKAEQREQYIEIGKAFTFAPPPFKEPTKALAGIIAPFEKFGYTVGTLFGTKTPRVPPTLISLSPEEREKALEYGSDYVVGTLLGDVLLAYGIGKAVEPVTKPIIKVVQTKAQKWVTSQYLEGPIKWKGLSEKIVMKITGVKPYIATGEVAIPDITRGAVSLAKLEASYGAWEMALAPKTGGVWIGKYAVEETPKQVLPLLIARGGKITIGYLVEYGFQREARLTPLVSQTQLTRMGIYPYTSKIGYASTMDSISKIFTGFGVSTFIKTLPKPEAPQRQKVKWVPTFDLQRIQYTPLKDFSIERQKEEAIPMLEVPQISEATTAQITKQVTVQKLKVPQKLKPIIPTKTTLTTPKIIFPQDYHFLKPKKKQPKDLFGAWYKKEHPIKTPEQMLKTYVGVDLTRRRGAKK